MAIITIARELGSWTSETAVKLNEALGGLLLDKEKVEGELLAKGLTDQVIQRYDERKPGFFSSFSSDQDIYLIFLKTMMLEAAEKNPITVIVGRGGNIIMKRLPNCLRIRLIAPEKLRVRNIMEEFQCPESVALKMIKASDSNRAGFCQFHFNANWSSPVNYDIVLNTEKLGTDGIIEAIKSAVKHHITPERERAGAEMLKNLLLAQRVVSHIIIDRKLSLAFLEATATADGHITLLGATSSPATSGLANDAAAEVEGVTKVINKIQVAVELAHVHM
jgi:cytidylate kinase